nr:transposase [Alkalihalobacillus deserti]
MFSYSEITYSYDQGGFYDETTKTLKKKLNGIREVLETGKKSIVARHYKLNPNIVSRWIREYNDGKYGDTQATNIELLEVKKLSQDNDQLKSY